MKKNTSKINLNVKVEENFLKKLRSEVEEEIDVASGKWSVNLSTKDRESIVRHTFNQLFIKVSDITKNSWTGEDIIKVRVFTRKDLEDINIDKNSSFKEDIRLIKLRDRWEFTSEEIDENIIEINSFYEYFIGKIFEWARTAAFYGVSSFA